MLKPRLVIADSELSYIIPLLNKFIDSYFNDLEIEVITDNEYFKRLFSSPQDIEILIVSEEMYDESVLRHNIKKLVVLSEQHDIERSVDNSVVKLYKYTSVSEVYNKIVGFCGGILDRLGLMSGGSKIILLSSASGGVGKTTLSFALASYLVKNYKRVLYVEAARMQTFQRMINNHSYLNSPDLYIKLYNSKENAYEDVKHYIKNDGFDYLPAFKAPLMSLGLEYGIYENIIMGAKKSGEYDFIIVDADVSFDSYKARLFDISDTSIIITNLNATSIYSTDLLVNNIKSSVNDKFLFVCNAVDVNKAFETSYKASFQISEFIEYVENIESVDKESFDTIKGVSNIAMLTM